MMVVLLLLLLVSCSSPFGINTVGYVEQNEKLVEAWKQTASFSYQSERKDYWKSPHEFERDGGGDCDDFAVYLCYLLGHESEVLVIAPAHVVVRYRGLVLEPQRFLVFYWDVKILSVYTYREAMLRATRWGTKKL